MCFGFSLFLKPKYIHYACSLHLRLWSAGRTIWWMIHNEAKTMYLYPLDDKSGGYFGSACGPRQRPSRWFCGRASTYSFDPIVFKFGVGICYGKGTKPVVFGGNPESKMAGDGHFVKKLTSDFCCKTCFRQFPAKKTFLFFLPRSTKTCLALDFFFFFGQKLVKKKSCLSSALDLGKDFTKFQSDSNLIILDGHFGQLLVGIFNCNHFRCVCDENSQLFHKSLIWLIFRHILWQFWSSINRNFQLRPLQVCLWWKVPTFSWKFDPTQILSFWMAILVNI